MVATLATARTAPAGASVWPRYPTSYEINSWVWLSELSQKYGRKVNLSSVPSVEWDAIAAYGFDAVWLMRVWERSPAGISIAYENKNLLDDFRRALPDFRPDDNVGSPYFPSWPDVLQLNAFEPALPRAVIETVSSIAQQCDGMRCDMAMLLLNSIFERTWGGRAGPRPATEYWVDVISTIKNKYPRFLFIAEAYWDLEWELQQQGFDFCYDQKLYDRLEHCNAESIRLHLCAGLAYQGKLLRFIENHDEPRAAATFSPAKERAVALTIATLPGIRLFHQGQFDGRKIRLPVFLGRRPDEPADQELQEFYKKLSHAVNRPIFREGQWGLCGRTGWPNNATFQNLVAWNWVKDDQRYLIVGNLSDGLVQARVQVRWTGTGGGNWLLTDALSSATYERDEDEMLSPGLYVELGPWNYHFFQCLRTNQT
jgi:hypothetical protein